MGGVWIEGNISEHLHARNGFLYRPDRSQDQGLLIAGFLTSRRFEGTIQGRKQGDRADTKAEQVSAFPAEVLDIEPELPWHAAYWLLLSSSVDDKQGLD